MRRLFARAASSRQTEIPLPGELVAGKYRIIRVIGRGGMGVVLAAHHELLNRRVAVKVLTVHDRKGVSRFLREARSTACLSGLHVVHVMDVGRLPSGAPFIVMEHLEGCDLKQLVETRMALPVEEAVGYVLQACEGLAQAHALGIVHRDLKPANLFLTAHPNGSTIIKIVDFGISKPLANGANEKMGTLTEEHSTLGSPAYMAPEQIRTAKDVDTRSDLWSLGVVLFELLTGAPPYATKSLGELFAAVLESDAPSLATVLPEAPAGLCDAVAKCMQRDRANRFQTVLELAQAIAPFGPDDASARVASIEQVMQNMKPRPLPAVKAPPRPSTGAPPSAVQARSGSVTSHVAFSSDSPAPSLVRGGTTVPSERRKRVRAAQALGALGAMAVVTMVALLRSSPPEPPKAPAAAPVVAVSDPPPEPTNEPGLEPSPPPVPARVSPAPPGSVAPARSAPQPRAPIGTASRHASVPTKRHLSVLDSPD